MMVLIEINRQCEVVQRMSQSIAYSDTDVDAFAQATCQFILRFYSRVINSYLWRFILLINYPEIINLYYKLIMNFIHIHAPHCRGLILTRSSIS
jgi:DNA-binding GntR family transcriptional regulator